MESSFASLGSQSDVTQNSLANDRLIIQQYAKYTSTNEPRVQSISPRGNSQKNNRMDHAMSPPSVRRGTPRRIQLSPRDCRLGINRTPGSQYAASISPAFSITSSDRHGEGRELAETRSLPSPDITDATMGDAYAAFILYCNPYVPSGTDTTELRRIFRMPPRSEGKSFSIFTLWQLIQKLDRKELKTWIQLAMELGVEPPSMEKKQSTQKVQQYAVRLKRWMRAMHVDAFFEYCLGHQHIYYTQLTSTDSSAESRDGVPRDEDLALRALFPQWKPKKGRKRAEAKEFDDSKTSKRPHFDIPGVGPEDNALSYNQETFLHSAMQRSAIPWSAFPDDLEQHDPFASHSALGTEPSKTGNHLNQHRMISRDVYSRWRSPGREVFSALHYPQSAITPRYRDSEAIMSIEPRSAITSSSADRANNKRRRGPAVSSAWSTSGNLSNTKMRGRPGGNRTTQNGPFSTFPVQSACKEIEAPETNTEHTGRSHSGLTQKTVSSNASGKASDASTLAPTFQPLNTRPARLQLQVPQNLGDPVRLATPPTVLVNGTSRNSPLAGGPARQQTNEIESNLLPFLAYGQQHDLSGAGFTLDDVAHAFSLNIHQGRLLNRELPLSLEESRSIADMAIKQVKTMCSPGLPLSVTTVYCAACLGVGYKLGLGGYPPGQLVVKVCYDSLGTKHQGRASTPQPLTTRTVARYSLSYDFIPANLLTVHATIAVDQNQESSSAYSGMGRVAEDYDSEDNILNESESAAVWKQRYLNIRKQNRKKDLALGKYKKKILEAVMEDI
ncbi:uncharacterized protein PADG_08418 [Paracoccidioides brasiliensis Pb18]|uniref:ARS binding protein Abp2 n=2 Tax=Paracoccidioides brasiliensis TaxID=121759 RepID=C1GM27_PARBD|nr:uncharacterized protein PADG_08418 [Paracoccidioides brasiliensis Pb18]EEH43493.2 hypothetical protein PADG_08418 [Paracoccidioides brasiliensis Pb18]ODH27248.1 hypothetical protein ACO22_04245 [Paracoccidioides brasiliensis]